MMTRADGMQPQIEIAPERLELFARKFLQLIEIQRRASFQLAFFAGSQLGKLRHICSGGIGFQPMFRLGLEARVTLRRVAL